MEVTRENRWAVVYHCYLAYFLSGMVILIFGVILPSLIEDRGISFTAAGAMLSILAVGNLMASLVYPTLCARIAQKQATVILSVFYPACLFLFTLPVPVTALYVLIFLIGIAKGMITIINNHAIRQVTGSSGKYLNLLHMWYAIGAFLSPFLTSVLMSWMGMGWKPILRILAGATVLIVAAYQTMDFGKFDEAGADSGAESLASAPAKSGLWFLKNASFWIAVILLFSYMGLENAVNGWFVTYLESTGLMSAALSAMMVSVTWVMIMVGRIVIASISGRVRPCVILAVITVMQFASIFMLIGAKTPAMAVAALVLMGLGMAGTFPTATAFTGDILGASPLGMSVFTGIAGIGGILTPQIIGVLADQLGFQAAILFLIFDGVLLAACGILTIPASRRRG